MKTVVLRGLESLSTGAGFVRGFRDAARSLVLSVAEKTILVWATRLGGRLLSTRYCISGYTSEL